MDTLSLALVVVAYFLGGVPVGVLAARSRGVDLFQIGSGNIGTTNVVRALGLRYGILVWLGDVGKGVVATLLPVVAGRPEAVTCMVAAAAVTGHCASPYLGLRGGRGIATSLGVLLVVQWKVGLIAFGLWVLVMLASRIVSLASLVAAASLVPLANALHPSTPLILLCALLTINGFVRHQANLDRLLRGEEHRFGRRTGEGGGRPGAGPEQ